MTISIVRKRLFLILFTLLSFESLIGQTSEMVTFSYQKQPPINGHILLTIKAKISPKAKLYAITTIIYDSVFRKYIQSGIEEKGFLQTEFDQTLNQKLNYYTDSIIWNQIIQVAETDSFVLKGTISFMCKVGEEYIPGEEKFKFFIHSFNDKTSLTDTNNQGSSPKSWWWIFVAAFGGGLLALLTPCVYSMIPVTVSFFTKRSKTKAEGIKNAIFYSFSIVFIFTGLGFLVTFLFGPAALNKMATNWIANLIFFLMFVLFGFSFLGAFEIKLPSSWMNKSDSKANTGSFLGIFFMALTLVLVSFSCTGPIIGNLLVIASKGSYLGPLIGMFGFSLALALPFALFAFFPSKLNVLGKAGGWLNAVKVTLGFLELALALKFLSNADLVMGWRLLDREIFICLWIVIFLLLGIYLLGLIRFQHDDQLPKNDFGHTYLSVSRLVFAITSLTFVVYLTPGLFGAPLKGISAFVPPMGTQDFVASGNEDEVQIDTINKNQIKTQPPNKYYSLMKIYEPKVISENNMVTYFDYAEALEVAKKMKKPLMLDFTGINCVNCRKMEGQVWSAPEVMKILKEDFVIVSLYVDVQNIDLKENEQYYSNSLQKQIETLGDKNADFQVSKFGANSQPYYFFLDSDEKKLVEDGYGYNPDIPAFVDLLEKVKAEYKKRNL